MATGLITTGAHPKAQWPGVHAWFGTYDPFPEQYTDIFDVKTDSKGAVEDVQTTGFGYAAIKSQGGSVRFTGQQQGWLKRYVHVVYGLGYICTREEIEDNQYKELSMKRAASLKFSMRATKEVVHANVANRAASSSYPGGDGVSLANASHPIQGSTFSNLLSPAADISEAALEDLGVMVMTAVNNEGIPIPLMMMSLHIHPNDWFEANRILKSVLQNDTANNAVNVLKMTSAIPDGIKMNNYFTDTDQFFIKTNCPDGFNSFQRRAIEFTKDNEYTSENAMAKSTERYSCGWTDPRCSFWSVGA